MPTVTKRTRAGGGPGDLTDKQVAKAIASLDRLPRCFLDARLRPKTLACFVVGALLLISPGTLLSESQTAETQDKVTVYIWKGWHVATLGRATWDIFLDEKPIAKLDRNRYFIAKIAPGMHTFRTKKKREGAIELDFKPGRTYYIRMDTTRGTISVGRPVLSLVSTEEETQVAIKQSKPIELSDKKDRAVVVFPEAPKK